MRPVRAAVMCRRSLSATRHGRRRSGREQADAQKHKGENSLQTHDHTARYGHAPYRRVAKLHRKMGRVVRGGSVRTMRMRPGKVAKDCGSSTGKTVSRGFYGVIRIKTCVGYIVSERLPAFNPKLLEQQRIHRHEQRAAGHGQRGNFRTEDDRVQDACSKRKSQGVEWGGS